MVGSDQFRDDRSAIRSARRGQRIISCRPTIQRYRQQSRRPLLVRGGVLAQPEVEHVLHGATLLVGVQQDVRVPAEEVAAEVDR